MTHVAAIRRSGHALRRLPAAGMILFLAAAAALGCGERPTRATVLNELRDEINSRYGTMANGTPRINCGPCVRFALAFRERWNERFRDDVNLACVMSDDGEECGHVALKFADGSYF